MRLTVGFESVYEWRLERGASMMDAESCFAYINIAFVPPCIRLRNVDLMVTAFISRTKCGHDDLSNQCAVQYQKQHHFANCLEP